MWHVYIIKTKCGKLYTGITIDIDRRFAEHLEMNESKQGRGAKFFRGHAPEKVVWSSSYPDRSEASKKESEIKKLSSSKKRALIDGVDD